MRQTELEHVFYTRHLFENMNAQYTMLQHAPNPSERALLDQTRLPRLALLDPP